MRKHGIQMVKVIFKTSLRMTIVEPGNVFSINRKQTEFHVDYGYFYYMMVSHGIREVINNLK